MEDAYWSWSDIDSVVRSQYEEFRQSTWDIDRTASPAKIVKEGWWETRFVDYWGWQIAIGQMDERKHRI